LFQRLLSSNKQFIKNPQVAAHKRDEVLSFLSLLLDPAFSGGKLLKTKDEVAISSRQERTLSFLLNTISSKVLYPSIGAEVLANYIKKQMSSPQKLKDLDFRINLKTGISMLALFLFKRFSLGSSIRGLRIVCSGR